MSLLDHRLNEKFCIDELQYSSVYWRYFQHRVPHCAGLLSHDADDDADDNPRKPYNPPGNFFGDDESKR